MEDQRAVRSYECEICYMNGPEFPGWDKSFVGASIELFRGLHGTSRLVIEPLFDLMDSIAGRFSRGGK